MIKSLVLTPIYQRLCCKFEISVPNEINALLWDCKLGFRIGNGVRDPNWPKRLQGIFFGVDVSRVSYSLALAKYLCDLIVQRLYEVRYHSSIRSLYERLHGHAGQQFKFSKPSDLTGRKQDAPT